MLLTLGLVLLLIHFVTKKGGGNLVPNAWQSLVERIYAFVSQILLMEVSRSNPGQIASSSPAGLGDGEAPNRKKNRIPCDLQGNPIDLNAPPAPELPGNDTAVPQEPDLETLPRGERGLSRAERARQRENLEHILHWRPKKPHAILEEDSSSGSRDPFFYTEYRKRALQNLAGDVSEILGEPIHVRTVNSILKNRITEDGRDIGPLTPFFKRDRLGADHELIRYILQELGRRGYPPVGNPDS
jgi:hypothetical protein